MTHGCLMYVTDIFYCICYFCHFHWIKYTRLVLPWKCWYRVFHDIARSRLSPVEVHAQLDVATCLHIRTDLDPDYAWYAMMLWFHRFTQEVPLHLTRSKRISLSANRDNPYPEPVYTGLVQCTLVCHWNATGWPSAHWDTAGRLSEYLQGTLEHHWKKNCWNWPTLKCHWRICDCCSLHWNTTGGTVTVHTYTGTYN